MKRHTLSILLVAVLGLLLPLFSFTGCASSGSGSSGFDYQAAGIIGKGTLRTTTKLVLDNNPDALAEVQLVNSSVAVLFGGGLTAEAIAGQIQLVAPSLAADDVALFAANLADAVEYYRLKSGKDAPSLNLGTPEVQALVKALTDGISEGIALHLKGKA